MAITYVEEASARLSALENLTRMLFVEFAKKAYPDDPHKYAMGLAGQHLYAIKSAALGPRSGTPENILEIQSEMIRWETDWFEIVLEALKDS